MEISEEEHIRRLSQEKNMMGNTEKWMPGYLASHDISLVMSDITM
ncbi:Uncharacterised protein [Serratia quinivorans]|nr:hypothetical protein [Serratia quinivorans]CAI1705804.1 Uncharacterised protein [Serratia quinivorans]